MAGSSNGSTGRPSSTSRNRWSDDVRCGCDEIATFSISRSEQNPGRKFRGCPNYKEKSRRCGFFMWVDPPLETNQARGMGVNEVHIQILKIQKVLMVMLLAVLALLLVLVLMTKKVLHQSV